MKYGYFDDGKREYVITNPKTPVTWINYVGKLGFGGFVNHTGGMLICKGDPALNRIIKYIPQMPASDFKGSTLYLRIQQGDGYKLFSSLFLCLHWIRWIGMRVMWGWGIHGSFQSIMGCRRP